MTDYMTDHIESPDRPLTVAEVAAFLFDQLMIGRGDRIFSPAPGETLGGIEWDEQAGAYLLIASADEPEICS